MSKSLKRKRPEKEGPSFLMTVSNITDYEDEFLTKSSNDFEYIIKKIKSTRKMTQNELDFEFKIRRRILKKGYEKARRLRKKNYVNYLEERNKCLERLNELLRRKSEINTARYNHCKNELDELKREYDIHVAKSQHCQEKLDELNRRIDNGAYMFLRRDFLQYRNQYYSNQYYH